MGLSKRTKAVLAAATLPVLFLGARPANAAELFWSSDGTTQGGAALDSAAWNTTNIHWGSSASGPFTSTWNNANVDSATFGGTAGVVEINDGSTANAGTPITVNVIKTTVSGFSIGNGNSANTANRIAFTGAGAGINAQHATGTTTLTANWTGTLTKTGTGRLELGNGSTVNTVKYVIEGGFVSMASAARLSGTAPGSLVQDFLTFNGGGLGGGNTAVQNLGNRGVTILAGGAFLGASGVGVVNGANHNIISAPIVGTAGGGLTVTNAGPFYSPYAAGGIWEISNTGNSWNGATTVAGGTLRLGGSGVIPDGSAVTVSAGTLDVNGQTETVGSLAGSGTVANVGGLTVGGSNANTSYNGAMLGATGTLAKVGSGTLTLGGTAGNTRGGLTSVNGGTLALGKTAGVNAIAGNVAVGDGTGTDTLRLVNSNQISDDGNMTLNSGVFDVNSQDETVGTLDVDGTSTIDFGAGADSILSFANSSGVDWTGGLLNILNWSGSTTGGGPEGLFFGTSAAGLTSDQLALIRFADGAAPGGFYGATILPTGEVVAAVPEPGSIGLALLGGAALALRRRRRA